MPDNSRGYLSLEFFTELISFLCPLLLSSCFPHADIESASRETSSAFVNSSVRRAHRFRGLIYLVSSIPYGS